MANRSYVGSMSSAEHMITLDTSLKAYAPPQDDLHATIGNFVPDHSTYPQTPIANYADASFLNGSNAVTPSRVPFHGAQGSSHVGVMESRSSTISPHKVLRNAPPDTKLRGASGPIQAEEADEIFDRIDLNADGIITHAELARSTFHTPEIAERLHQSGDTPLMRLVVKGRERVIVFSDEETLSRHELRDLLCHSNARGAKSSRFITAYGLDQGGEDGRAATALERVSVAMEGLLVNETKDDPISAFSRSQGLVQSNHELTRRLQLNLVKSEKDDARIQDLEETLSKERTARLELESQMRVEMKLALEVMKGQHLAVVQNMQAKNAEEAERSSSQNEAAVRELREEAAEHAALLRREAESREAQMRGQMAEMEDQRADLQRQLADLQAQYDDLFHKGEAVEDRLAQMNAKVNAVENEKAKLMDELAAMTKRADQLQRDKDALEEQGLNLDKDLNNNRQLVLDLKEEVRKTKEYNSQIENEKLDLWTLIREHEVAHEQKDRTVRQTIALGKQAIEERHDLARRQVAAWTELEVQRAICRANNGILAIDALDAIRVELGHTVGDPDVPISVASVTGERTLQDQDFDKMDPSLAEHNVAPRKMTARERREKLKKQAAESGQEGGGVGDGGGVGGIDGGASGGEGHGDGISEEVGSMGLRRFGQFRVSKKGMGDGGAVQPASHRAR